MFLKKSTNRKTGRTYLSIVHGYYDPKSHSSRTKTVRSLGYLDELEKIYDDPITHFSMLADEMEEERKKENASYTFFINKQERLPFGSDLTRNFGYAAVSSIYHELGIHSFLRNCQRYIKNEFDSNVIMQMLVYSRILFPDSIKVSYEKRDRFFEKTDYSLDDVYRCLTFLDKYKEDFRDWLNERVRELYGCDAGLLYNDMINYYNEIFVSTKEYTEAYILICFVAHMLTRILEIKTEHRYNIEKLIDSMAQSNCTYLKENFYLFNYYDEVLEWIGEKTGIEFNHKVLSLQEIKKILGETKK